MKVRPIYKKLFVLSLQIFVPVPNQWKSGKKMERNISNDLGKLLFEESQSNFSLLKLLKIFFLKLHNSRYLEKVLIKIFIGR